MSKSLIKIFLVAAGVLSDDQYRLAVLVWNLPKPQLY